MNVLIPKKGSKEQVKVEEGRLLYAMVAGKQINLAKMVVDRLKAALGRKSVPICYGMHLTEMMAQAGVDLHCAGDEEFVISSTIDHHTLKRLGYRRDIATWSYVGRGKVNVDRPRAAPSEPNEDSEDEQEHATTGQEETTAPSQAPPSRFSSTHHTIQTEIAHLRNFMIEQFQFLRATIMSKLDSIESRVQACEHHLGTTSRASPPHPYTDPKGKAPMVSPIPSPIPSPRHSPIPSPSIPSIPSPSPSPAHHSPPTEPVPVPSDSSSSESASQHYELSARTPTAQTKDTSSSDSEATPSDPTRFAPFPPSPPPTTEPPASTPAMRTKQPAIKNPTYTPSPSTEPSPTEPSPPKPLQTIHPSPSPKPAIYTRRKLAVSRPGTSSPPPPPQSKP